MSSSLCSSMCKGPVVIAVKGSEALRGRQKAEPADFRNKGLKGRILAVLLP